MNRFNHLQNQDAERQGPVLKTKWEKNPLFEIDLVIARAQIIDALYSCGISKQQNEEKYDSRLRDLLHGGSKVSDEAEIVSGITDEERDNDD